MARTKGPTPEQPTAPRRTTRPEQTPVNPRRTRCPEITMENRCYWPCPCGGTVPDAPDHCVFSTEAPKGHGMCVAATACLMLCGDRIECDAYKNYHKLVRARRAQDILKAGRKGENSEDEICE